MRVSVDIPHVLASLEVYPNTQSGELHKEITLAL